MRKNRKLLKDLKKLIISFFLYYLKECIIKTSCDVLLNFLNYDFNSILLIFFFIIVSILRRWDQLLLLFPSTTPYL